MNNSETFIISLDRTPERFEKTYNNLKQAGVEAKRFPATDANDIKVIDLKTKLTIKGSELPKYKSDSNHFKIICNQDKPDSESFIWKDKLLKKGEFGLWCSSFRIWQYAKANDLDYVIVFEDDVFAKGNKFKENLYDYLNKLPNSFDIGYIGASMHTNKNKVKVDEYISKPKEWWWGTYAITYSKLAIDKLLNTPDFHSPIDLYLTYRTIRENFFECYLPTKEIIGVDTSSSTIR